ncbi:MAG: hypothetical protein EZS28_005258 [Streblomastix strix]|uniref:Uncharacterized protein n=1 Tax=Streblomastix strix TaxID=222440 RepID=A0A5J4WWM3_9EUKA|nr:MAG: hypothetical protein EZS28_005258 [Streblomastix strix]
MNKDKCILNKESKMLLEPYFPSLIHTQIAKKENKKNNRIQHLLQVKLFLHFKPLNIKLALSRFKVGTHLKEEANKQSLEVRNKCRDCLWCIQIYGDEQVQSELVNVGYGRIMSITYSTAGGIGEEQDEEIYNGLCYIFNLFKELNEGRNNWQTSFQPLPLLVQRSEEQIEEEGAIEELEAQLDNKGINGHIKYCANMAKAPSLNHFIHRG